MGRGLLNTPKRVKASLAHSTNTSMFSSFVKAPMSWNHFGCTNQCTVTLASIPHLRRPWHRLLGLSQQDMHPEVQPGLCFRGSTLPERWSCFPTVVVTSPIQSTLRGTDRGCCNSFGWWHGGRTNRSGRTCDGSASRPPRLRRRAPARCAPTQSRSGKSSRLSHHHNPHLRSIMTRRCQIKAYLCLVRRLWQQS